STALAASPVAATPASRSAPRLASPSRSAPSSGQATTNMPTPANDTIDVAVARSSDRVATIVIDTAVVAPTESARMPTRAGPASAAPLNVMVSSPVARDRPAGPMTSGSCAVHPPETAGAIRVPAAADLARRCAAVAPARRPRRRRSAGRLVHVVDGAGHGVRARRAAAPARRDLRLGVLPATVRRPGRRKPPALLLPAVRHPGTRRGPSAGAQGRPATVREHS